MRATFLYEYRATVISNTAADLLFVSIGRYF